MRLSISAAVGSLFELELASAKCSDAPAEYATYRRATSNQAAACFNFENGTSLGYREPEAAPRPQERSSVSAGEILKA